MKMNLPSFELKANGSPNLVRNKSVMKNDPAFTYNHMEEDKESRLAYSRKEDETETLPISLYLILAADVILMGVLGFFIYNLLA